MIDDVITKSPNEEFDDINTQDRTFWTCISRPEVDRDREFCPVSAFIEDLSIYKTNPVLLLHHIHKSLPVGKAIDYKNDNKGLYVKYQIAKTPLGDEVLQLISEKCLRGISAGFIPIRFKDNPNDYELPIQARGKNVKRLYERVELVEVSLLAIPSNRNSLVIHSEKGARLNDIVYKTYDIDLKEDISYVLKEWMEDVEEKWFWSEDKHPRDEDGKFAGSNSSDDINTKLDKLAQSNKEMKDELDRIKSNQGLRGWAKKWAFRVGALVGGYYFLKSQTGKKVLRAGKDATVNYAKNKLNESNVGENVKNLSAMVDHATKALSQMEKLGLNKTSEYRDLQKTLDISKKAIDNIRKNTTKGFDDFISFGNDTKKDFNQFMLCKNFNVEPSLKGFYHSHDGFLQVVTKEADFEESEHPRDEDGKFKDKNSSSNESQATPEKIKGKVSNSLNNTKDKLDKIKNNVAENTTYSADKFINWVKENKVKTGIIASVGIASFPLISVALKSKGRLINLIYSPNNRKLVPWEALAEHEKLDVFKHVEPGDVFAWGGYQHRSFLDMFVDVKDYLKDKSNWRAKDRVIDIMAKTVSNSPYAHTVMCVGKYDEKFAKTLFDKTKESNGHIPILKRFIETSGISDGKNRDRLLDALKTRNEKKFIRISLKEWKGYPVLAGGTGGNKGIVNLSVTKSPVLGLESHAAIVKTNLDSKQREAIHQGLLKDYFKKTNLGLKLAITESPKKNIDILAHNIGDPVTSFTVKHVMGKKSDALLCGGVVAKLIKTYTGVELNNSKNIRYFTVKDLLKDKKFIKEVIEPRVGTRKKDTDIAKILATTGGVTTAGIVGHKLSKERMEKSFSNMIIKEMSEDTFEESEHPRANDGKFKKKLGDIASGDLQTIKDNKLLTAGVVTATVATAYASSKLIGKVLGKKIYSGSSIADRCENSLPKIKEEVSHILEDTAKDANPKIVDQVLNIKIIKDIDYDNLDPIHKKAFDYVDSPQFQKDVLDRFSHMEGFENIPSIKLSNKPVHVDFAVLGNPNATVEEKAKGMQAIIDIQPCYNHNTHELNLNYFALSQDNPSVINTIKEISPTKDLEDALQRITMHEYGHSLTMMNEKIKLKYLNEYEKKAEKFLMGQETTDGYIINKVSVDKANKFFQNVSQEPLLPEIHKHLAGKRWDEIKDSKDYPIVLTATHPGLPEDHARKTLTFSLQNVMLQNQMAGGTLFKNISMENRDLYSFQNIFEYLAVMAERGMKI